MSPSLLVLCALGARGPVKTRLPTNTKGNLFVDSSCINCDTCRWMAPETFGHAQGKSYVARQPESATDRRRAAAAAVACPTGSIRTEAPMEEAKEAARDLLFPAVGDRAPHVRHIGLHSPKSFGGAPYLIAAPGKPVVLVDSPRYSSKAAKRIEELHGAPELMLLTHIDDVGDHDKWAARFPGMRRVLHASEIRGPERWPYTDLRGVEMPLEDAEASSPGPGRLQRWTLAEGLEALHTPGHTGGSVSYLADPSWTGGDGVLFSGDHVGLSGRLGRIDGFARYGDDLALQADSMAKLAGEKFLHVLPGHGRRFSFQTEGERREALEGAAEAFRRDPRGESAPGPLYITPETAPRGAGAR